MSGSKGRPSKKKLKSKRKGTRGKVGRPKGDHGIIEDFKARMLASPKSAHVLKTIFDAALDDEHKHQSAAWKLIMDRVAPTSFYQKEGTTGPGKITVNITGVGDVSLDAKEEDYIDHE